MSSPGKIQHKVSKDSFMGFCDLFNLQVQKNPNAKAVIFEGKSLTYKELDNRSTQLAKVLKLNGVGIGKIVALGLYNSLDLLVSTLGIFKSGGVYLPIDPNYPMERIETMLDDAKPHVFLTETSLCNKFSKFPNAILLIDKLPHVKDDVQLESIQPDELAYVIYTSGSTGKPKGIMVEHKGLSHAALAYQELHPERPVSLMTGSISFDPSLLIISHALISGGTLCLPQNKTGIDPEHPEELIALIDKHSISHLLCTPSLYAIILDKSQKLPTLKSVDLCAENIPNNLPRIHATIASNAFLYNAYGPTEYAMGATAAKIYDPLTNKISKVTIGKAFSSNNKLYILDKNLQKVSTGVKGEIFIGGPGLAKGYLNQEALSAEKFFLVSLSSNEPIRLYRTGDLGRFLPNGNIEFLGRSDYQVKILGHRIELEEIEYALHQYPGVNVARVILQKEKNGQKQLVAFYSSTSKKQISGNLRAYLQQKLPSFMIPSIFIPMTSWPYTQNGKIDRTALKKALETETSRHREAVTVVA